MIRKTDLLNGVEVAKPCLANWDEMDGDASKRFCGRCRHHVHNLSEMTSDEAESLLANATGRLCVRFVKDAAGTVITRDRRPRRISWWGRMALAASALLTVFGFQGAPGKPAVEQGDVALPKSPSKTRQILGRIAIPKPLQGKVAPRQLQGEVAVPTTGIVAPNHVPKSPPKVVKRKKPVVKKGFKTKPVVKPKPVQKPKPKP